MTAIARKSLLIVLKLAVLSGVIYYASRMVKLDDELLVATAKNAPPVRLVDAAGAAHEFKSGARLAIVEEPPTSAAITVATPDGTRLSVATEQISGSEPTFQRVPGVRSLFRTLHWPLVGIALLLLGVPNILIGVRWLILLRACEVHIPIWNTLRLHFLGLFFNTFMPGGAGGDVIKAFAITSHTHRAAEAVSTIVVDRVVGFVVLILYPALTLALVSGKAASLAPTLLLIIAALAAVSLLYFSEPVRRALRWNALRARLPGHTIITRVDEAIYGLRRRKRYLVAALALSFGFQLVAMLAMQLAARAIGMSEAKYYHFLIYGPIGLMFNALPISFGGVGLMEGAFLTLFSEAGVATPAQGCMLAVVYRLLTIIWTLPGGLFALTGTGRVHTPHEIATLADVVASEEESIGDREAASA